MDYAYESLVNDICVDVANEEILTRYAKSAHRTHKLFGHNSEIMKSWKEFNSKIKSATDPKEAIALCEEHLEVLKTAYHKLDSARYSLYQKADVSDVIEGIIMLACSLSPLLRLPVLAVSSIGVMSHAAIAAKIELVGNAIKARKKLTRELVIQLKRDKDTISDDSKEIINNLVKVR